MSELKSKQNVRFWLKCVVSAGLFPNEFSVKSQTFDGREYSLFTERKHVLVDRKIPEKEYVPGLLSVTVGEQKDDLVLITLPNSTMDSGRFVTVKRDQIVSL